MTCANCGAENRADAKFCSECGVPQAMGCPSCSASVDADDKFCAECGHRLGEPSAPSVDSGPSLDGTEERRFVTALFIDLVGFTPMTEARDSEEVRRMLTVYFDRARDIVDRFGGVIDKYIGDAVMAVWGARTAHEDDAERAVRAALELVDAVDQVGTELGIPELAARAGVLSGEAVVGGDGNATTGLIVGDTVNTASRLQSSAEPGTVLVGRSTKDLSARSIEYRKAGDLDLKGKSDLVEAWQAVRVLSGMGGNRRADGIVPPYVGRADELRLLKDTLHSVERDDRLRMVSVIGQGGIGKSRLVDELWGYVDGLQDTFYWHHGRSLSYGENAGFWAISEMVKQRCGMVDGDDEHTVRTRLRTTLLEFVPEADDRAWIEPKLESLLGIGSGVAERAELFAAWRLFFTSIASQGPVVLVFEDLHWADEGVLEFIEELVEVAVDIPLLVLTLARPQLIERRTGWGQGRANSVSLHLAPLAPRTMEQLLLGVVPDAPSMLVQRMVDRSGGVPLYAVEMMRMLFDRGTIRPSGDGSFSMSAEVDDIDIPDSLHGLVGARLDQFPPDVRALIADAAILGQSFRLEGLLAFRHDDPEELRARLDGLVRTEVLSLNRDPRSPERGQYQFVQSIIREVAHERVSRADRLRLHSAVARFYESLDEPELSGVVASHWLDAVAAAGDGPEAEEVRARASESLLAAADRAGELGSFAQVVSLCLRGVDLAVDPVDRAKLLARAARAAHSALDERARDLAKRAVDESSSSNDSEAMLFAASVRAKLLDDVGESHEAWPHLRSVLEQHPGETPLHVTAMAELARAFMLDDQAEVVETTERALAMAERLGMVREVAELWATRGAFLATSGRMWEAEVILNAALELAREHQLLATKRRAMANLLYMSDAIVNTFADEVIEDARRLGDDLLLVEALQAKAWAAFVFLKWEEQERILQEIERLATNEAIREDLQDSRDNREMLIEDPVVAQRRIEERWARMGSGDQQTEVNRELQRAAHAFYRGEFTEAFERAMAVDHRSPSRPQLNWALVAALRVGRRDALEAVHEANQDSVRGRLTDMRANSSAGALAALDGDIGEAEARFTAAIETSGEIWGPIFSGFIKASSRHYVGMEHPTARAWARQTHEAWAAAGAKTLLDLFSDLLPPLDGSVAETG